MNVKHLAIVGAVVFALVGLSVPVTGYHINGTLSGTVAGLTSGDWIITGVPNVIICESDGNDNPAAGDLVDGAAADDRNDNAAGPLPGQRGLCTTGRNDATGLIALLARPALDTWLRLDTCGLTVVERDTTPPAIVGVSAALPTGRLCVGPGPDLIMGTGDDVTGSTTDTSWIADLGAYSCRIPRAANDLFDNFNDGTGLLGPTTGDMSLYYQNTYSWWAFDGDGTYTVGTPEDGGTTGVDPLPSPPGSDIARAWKGHVAMFIRDTDDANLRGSAVIEPRPPPSTFSGGTTTGTAAGKLGREPINPTTETRGNNCGSSPAGSAAVGVTTACGGVDATDPRCGPVIRAGGPAFGT